LQVNGLWANPASAVSGISSIPANRLFRKQALRIAAGVVMLGFSFIPGFTIGLFYQRPLPCCWPTA
jgi:hypothetical protein